MKFILSPAGRYEYTKIRFFVAESRIKIVKLISVKIPQSVRAKEHEQLDKKVVFGHGFCWNTLY